MQRLTVAGRDCSSLADGMSWQVEAIGAVLVRHGIEPLPPVTPVLRFLNVEWPLLGAPDGFRGVRLESPQSIKRLLKAAVLTEAQADQLVALLAEELPPK